MKKTKFSEAPIAFVPKPPEMDIKVEFKTQMFYIKTLSILIFISSSMASFSQANCTSNNTLSDFFKERKARDTLFKSSVDNGIKYYVFLNRELFPAYWNLKKDILSLIENDDIKALQELKNNYNNQVDSMLNEFKSTNERVYKNIMATSNINNLLIIENFRSFPDVFAILLYPTVVNRNVNSTNETIVKQLYTKYKIKLTPFESCINKFRNERIEFIEKNNVPQIFQAWGVKSDEETLMCDLVDLLLWASK